MIKKKNHSAFSLFYHIVLVTKYRKNILNEDMKSFIKDTCDDIANNYDFTIKEFNSDKDHIHILVKSQPKVSPLQIVRTIKQITTVRIWNKFDLSNVFFKEKTLWSDGYYVSTTGGVSIEILKKYIENQGNDNFFQTYTAQKIKLNPNKEQIHLFEQFFGENRAFYNYLVYCGKEKIKPLTYNNWALEQPWKVVSPGQSFQQTNRFYKKALKATFSSGFGFPKFKKKSQNQSFKTCQPSKIFEENKYRIEKCGLVKLKQKIRYSNIIDIKNYTVSKEYGKYFISFQFIVIMDVPLGQSNNKSIGIDLGLTDFLVSSDGDRVLNPRWVSQMEKISSEQVKLSRKKGSKKGEEKSKSFLKKQKEINRKYSRIVNHRTDFLHKLSKQIVNESQVICCETLSIEKMLKNHNLSKYISSVGWGMFVNMLIYKSQWNGKELIQVDRYFASSQLCNDCGYKHVDLQLSDRSWVCPSCGKPHDRDLNASKNILDEGIKNAWGKRMVS